jgi:hypothetical protein
VVKLSYSGGTYSFRLVSVSHWNGITWERIKDVHRGEIGIPDGAISIRAEDGQMQFLVGGGLMLEARDPRDAPRPEGGTEVQTQVIVGTETTVTRQGNYL